MCVFRSIIILFERGCLIGKERLVERVRENESERERERSEGRERERERGRGGGGREGKRERGIHKLYLMTCCIDSFLYSLCCVAAVKNFRQWLISRKTGDKAHLISPGDDELSEEGSPGQARKNGSVAMAGVAAALTNEDSKINAKSEK